MKQFVLNFELPISEPNYAEMVRKLLKRNPRPITYDVFKEVLIEIFFLAEAEDIYNRIEDEISLTGDELTQVDIKIQLSQMQEKRAPEKD